MTLCWAEQRAGSLLLTWISPHRAVTCEHQRTHIMSLVAIIKLHRGKKIEKKDKVLITDLYPTPLKTHIKVCQM